MKILNRKDNPGADGTMEDTQEFKQANITLYIPGTGISDWTDRIQKIFSSNITGISPDNDGMTDIHFHDGTDMFVSVVQDPENVKSQMDGMAEFFSKAPVSNKELHDMFLIQITLFRTIIGFSFTLNSDENRSNAIIGGIMKFAEEINGFALFPDMSLHHPSGKLLVSIEGNTDFDSYYPIASKESVSESKPENEADIRRKERNNAVLKEKGIPFLSDMPVSAYDSDSVIPSKEDIIHRLAACFCACVTAEVYSGGNIDDCKSVAAGEYEKLENLYGISGYLSENEKQYIQDTPEDANVHAVFGWRYEGCSVLLWSLSLIDLKKPDEYCDAAELGKIIWNNDFETLLSKSVLRSRDEILDMQDLIHRYHWACIDSRIKNEKTEGLNEEIIYEWHYALNWLTGVGGNKNWDTVPVRA